MNIQRIYTVKYVFYKVSNSNLFSKFYEDDFDDDDDDDDDHDDDDDDDDDTINNK